MIALQTFGIPHAPTPSVHCDRALALLLVQLASNHPTLQATQPFVAAPAGFLLIAHAGGGLPHGTYSNSINAMDQAIAHGFDLIEIDFSRTFDGKMVAIHDWRDSYFNWFELSLVQQMKHRLGLAPNADQSFACCKQLIACLALDVNGSIPTRAGQLREPGSI